MVEEEALAVEEGKRPELQRHSSDDLKLINHVVSKLPRFHISNATTWSVKSSRGSLSRVFIFKTTWSVKLSRVFVTSCEGVPNC